MDMTPRPPGPPLPTRVFTSPSMAAGPGPSPPMPSGQIYGERYRTQAVLGAGGFGVVWRAFDLTLQAAAVIKVIHLVTDAERAFGQVLLDSPPIEGALRHPNVAPIRGRGAAPEGIWLAMDLIEGGTFLDLIAELHPTRNAGRSSTAVIPIPKAPPPPPPVASADTGAPPEPPAEPDALVEALHLLVQAGRGLGAAHAAGIAHRDLKPDNLMFEDRPSIDGSTQRIALVIDWGLALSRDPRAAPAHPVPPGAVVGVPEYLAPERLDGRDEGSPRSDVYALGAILYHMLTGDPPPVGGLPSDATGQGAWAEMPEWFAVCRIAMADNPADRFADGAAFAKSLAAALEEARLREHDDERRRARRLRAEGDALREKARAALAPLQPWQDPTLREPGWALEDEARDRALAAARAEARWLAEVESSLRRMPDLPTGYLRLADHHAERLCAADDADPTHDSPLHADRLAALCDDIRRARRACRKRGVLFAPAVEALADAALARHHRLLDGRASLSLATEPPGRAIEFARVVERKRRWVTEDWEPLGVTPIEAVAVPHGSVVVRVHFGEGRVAVLPLRLRRNEHHDGIAPGDRAPSILSLPPRWKPGREAFVPAGWAWIGGAQGATDPIARRRVWIDGFVMMTMPVTFAEYGMYLASLAAQGRHDEVEDGLPRFRPEDGDGARRGGARPSRGIERRRDGSVVVDEAFADLPVCYINWWNARAYAAWCAQESGLPWRLPSEWEYEKAARGADGRRLPWGDHMEERWTRVVNSTAEQSQPVPVSTETLDVSVYGIRWLVGNRMTWCLESYESPLPQSGERIEVVVSDEDPRPLRIARGGAFCVPSLITSAASRFAEAPHNRMSSLGIRLVRSFEQVREA